MPIIFIGNKIDLINSNYLKLKKEFSKLDIIGLSTLKSINFEELYKKISEVV